MARIRPGDPVAQQNAPRLGDVRSLPQSLRRRRPVNRTEVILREHPTLALIGRDPTRALREPGELLISEIFGLRLSRVLIELLANTVIERNARQAVLRLDLARDFPP